MPVRIRQAFTTKPLGSHNQAHVDGALKGGVNLKKTRAPLNGHRKDKVLVDGHMTGRRRPLGERWRSKVEEARETG